MKSMLCTAVLLLCLLPPLAGGANDLPGIMSLLLDKNNTLPDDGPDYYVSVSGDDTNDGSSARPWQTISHAASMVREGTIHVTAGTYREHVKFIHSGTPEKRLVIRGENGAVIDGSAGFDDPDFGLLTIEDASNISLTGLTVANVSSHGIMILGDCRNITISRCITRHTRGSGIIVQGNHGFPWDEKYHVSGITIDHNEIHWPQEGRWDGHNIWQEDITLMQGVEHFVISSNYVNAYDGDQVAGGPIGIDVKNGVRYGTIHHNRVVNIPSSGIYIDADKTYVHHIDIYNNRIDNITGYGIEVGAEWGGPVSDVNIYNNIISNAGLSGFASGDFTHGPVPRAKTNIKVFNNTFYNTGRLEEWGWGIITESSFQDSAVYNNIFANCAPAEFNVNTAGNNVYTHNCSDGNGDNYGDPKYYGENAVIGNPRFTDISAGDFTLEASSPCIDGARLQGAPPGDYSGRPRPTGKGVDMGAYER